MKEVRKIKILNTMLLLFLTKSHKQETFSIQAKEIIVYDISHFTCEYFFLLG